MLLCLFVYLHYDLSTSERNELFPCGFLEMLPTSTENNIRKKIAPFLSERVEITHSYDLDRVENQKTHKNVPMMGPEG